jgi:hypothetical protein
MLKAASERTAGCFRCDARKFKFSSAPGLPEHFYEVHYMPAVIGIAGRFGKLFEN